MTKRTLLDDMTDAERKAVPLALVFEYFPNAIIALAQVIASGQAQHGTEGWDKTKSNDHANTLLRHFLQRGTSEKDGTRHSAKVFWRAGAALELEIEAELAATAKPARNRHAKATCKAGPNCRTCAAQRRKRS